MYSTNIIVLTFICVLTCTVEPCFAIPATLRTKKSGWISEVAGSQGKFTMQKMG